MRNKKTLISLAFVGIVIIVLFMITATYAYFSIEVTGRGNNFGLHSYDSDMSITFNDTSNITLVNAYTGDSITKTFSIKNTGDIKLFYNIVFSELVNNFDNPYDLVYSISSTDGGINKESTVIPTEDNSLIGSHIEIEPDETHTYTLTVTFLKTEYDQSNNMNKTFSTKVSVEPVSSMNNIFTMFDANTLGNALLSNNIVLSENSVNFNEAAVNGLYSTNNTIDGVTSYYFRGDNTLNNNVLFAGYCWKIIRTTEDLGIRLIFNGTPVNNSCSTVNNTNIATGAFNANKNYNAYVGFKYGSPNSSTYSSEHTNTNRSTIKTELDSWYTTNLSTYTSYIEDSYYCNNRRTVAFEDDNIAYTSRGFTNNNTGYDTYHRLSILNKRPVLFCDKRDTFTVTNIKGNASGSTNPIALLNVEEAVLAGYNIASSSATNYLNNGSSYWTMTPAYFYSNEAYNYYINGGNISEGVVNNTTYGIRPVVTLKGSTTLLNGNGSAATPYRITN